MKKGPEGPQSVATTRPWGRVSSYYLKMSLTMLVYQL